MKVLAIFVAIFGAVALFDGVLMMNETSMIEGILLFNLAVGCWIVGSISGIKAK